MRKHFWMSKMFCFGWEKLVSKNFGDVHIMEIYTRISQGSFLGGFSFNFWEDFDIFIL